VLTGSITAFDTGLPVDNIGIGGSQIGRTGFCRRNVSHGLRGSKLCRANWLTAAVSARTRRARLGDFQFRLASAVRLGRTAAACFGSRGVRSASS
jgi:hypothetical protein